MTAAGEWTRRRLGDIATLRSGGTPPSHVSRYYGGRIPWVSISDMTASGKYVRRTARTLTDEGVAGSAATLYEPGVVLYAMYASLGECSIAVGSVSSSQAILGISPGPELDQEFLYYFLDSIRGSIRSLGQHGTQSNLNAGLVRDLQVPLPPLVEQRRIASSLGDVDELIEALRRLADKKRAMRDGVADDLLARRVRRPGFHAPWEGPVAVDDLATRRSGYWGRDVGAAEVEARVIRAGDVSAHHRLTGFAVRSLTAAEAERARCDVNDVIITTSGTIGNVALVPDCGYFVSNFVRMLRPRDGVSGRFLFYALRTARARAAMRAHLGISAMPNLGSGFFRERWMEVPSPAEQRAIAEVIHDADAEIDALERRIEKTRLIKQGMMQELLSGRTRLPVSAGAAA